MKIIAALLLLSTACAASPTPPAAAPGAASTGKPAAAEPAAESSLPTKTGPPSRPAPVPPPPAECAAYGREPEICARSGPTLTLLAAALDQKDPLQRDHDLACIEVTDTRAAGALRALRAELAPLPCADAVVTPFLERRSTALDPDEENALLGLLVAGQLARLVGAPPSLAPPFDKPKFLAFFEKELKPWMVSQALAIGELSLRGARLHGYGKAIAAVEAGVCDLRFVQAVRQVGLPEELASDAEFKNVYFASLDEALEPRKARGRDAALVGLRLFFELGVLADKRVERARDLLSKLYAGSHVDALDALLLPELPPLQLSDPDARLAAALPTFYALRLLGAPKDASEPRLLRAWAEQGLPPELRATLDGARLTGEARIIYAGSEARRGVRFFSGPAFRHAAELASAASGDEAAEFLAALGVALQGAPRDSAELMLGPRRAPGSLGSLDALDALAQRKGRYRAEAAFDAALIRWLTPPANDAAFWDDLAARFAAAKKLLPAASVARTRAGELEVSARETARTLRNGAGTAESSRAP